MLTKKKELYNRRRQRSEIDRILQKQRAFFAEGKTYEIRFRKAALKRLEASILAHEKEVCQALTEDLGKSETEGYMCEVGLTLAEIRGLYRNVKAYSKTKRVPVSMANFPAKGYLVQEPYGVTLVMSPWNYPFMLAMEPLRGKAVRLCTCNFGCHCSDCKRMLPGRLCCGDRGRQAGKPGAAGTAV